MPESLVDSLVLLLPAALLGLIVLAVATGRREPDPSGLRPQALYLFSVAHVSLFLALFTTSAMVAAVVRIGLPDSISQFAPGFLEPELGQPGFTEFSPNDEFISRAVQLGLVAASSVLVLWFHTKWIRTLVSRSGFEDGPARRTHRAYFYVVCFVAILTALFAGAFALYGLFRIIWPGISGGGFLSPSEERNEGIVRLVASAVLALGALGIFAFHWRRVMAPRTAATPEAPVGTID